MLQVVYAKREEDGALVPIGLVLPVEGVGPEFVLQERACGFETIWDLQANNLLVRFENYLDAKYEVME